MKVAMRKTLLAACLAATAGQTLAADSIDVKVTGEIVPAACTPALAGGSTIDYGTIKADTIASDDFTVLAVKTVGFSITCDAATKVGLTSADTRAGTAVIPVGKTLNGAQITGTTALMGLGTSGDKNIGAYAMSFATDVRLDDSSSAVDSIVSLNSGNTWTKDNSGGWLGGNTTSVLSWANAGSLTPQAFTTLTGTLNVQASINKGSELDLTQKVTLDGLSTISLVYL